MWGRMVFRVLTFIRAPGKKKKGFCLFSCGATPSQNRPPKPLQVGLFSTRQSRSEVPERGDFGDDKILYRWNPTC